MSGQNVLVGDIELSSRELATLVRLVRCLVGLDHRLTREETGALEGVGEQVDAERFWAHMQASFARPLKLDDVLREAAALDRLEAREALMSLLELIARSDAVVPIEAGFLRRLRELWQIGQGPAT